MKGIQVYSDSSVRSDYDEEEERLYGPRARVHKKEAPAKHQANEEHEVKSKVAGKFKAAGRLMGGHTKTRHEQANRDQEDTRAAQPKSPTRRKLKSATLMAIDASPRDAETSSASRPRRRQTIPGLRGSLSRGHQSSGTDDERSHSSGGVSSMMKVRSVDKAISSLRKKASGRKEDEDDSTVASAKSASSRRKPAGMRRSKSMAEGSSNQQQGSRSAGQRTAHRRQDSASSGGNGRRRTRKDSF